jgi:hypothetical protein
MTARDAGKDLNQSRAIVAYSALTDRCHAPQSKPCNGKDHGTCNAVTFSATVGQCSLPLSYPASRSLIYRNAHPYELLNMISINYGGRTCPVHAVTVLPSLGPLRLRWRLKRRRLRQPPNSQPQIPKKANAVTTSLKKAKSAAAVVKSAPSFYCATRSHHWE